MSWVGKRHSNLDHEAVMKRRTFTHSRLAFSATPLLASVTSARPLRIDPAAAHGRYHYRRAWNQDRPSHPHPAGPPAVPSSCAKTARWAAWMCEVAPWTRENPPARPTNAVQQVQAILLSGGSVYGLEAATGVMRYLQERKLGFKLRAGVVPVVPTAILMDFGVGDFTIRPDAEAGYQASPPQPQALGPGQCGGQERGNGGQDVRPELCHEERFVQPATGFRALTSWSAPSRP